MFEDADDIVIPGFSGVELHAEDFPIKLPEQKPRSPSTPSVTVHQYNHGSQRSLKLESDPLEIGRREVDMATTASGWRTVTLPTFECMSAGILLSSRLPTLNVQTQCAFGTTILLSMQRRPLFYCQKIPGSRRKSGENHSHLKKRSPPQI